METGNVACLSCEYACRANCPVTFSRRGEALQNFNWDDLRIFLAVAREASITAAASALAMHQSTVSRRLIALEEDLGGPLVRRGNQGVHLTAHGRRLWEMAEAMEQPALDVGDYFRKLKDSPRGLVRLTTVEEIAVQIIIPGLAEFRKRWPDVEIELLTNSKILDLNRGEADVAIRLARPAKGAAHARKLGEFGYALFASEEYIDQLPDGLMTPLEELDWIVWEGHHLKKEEWDWLRSHIPDIKPVLRCNRFKTLVATVQAGLGASILPKATPYFHPGLVRFPHVLEVPKQELWLCVADDRRNLASVQAVCEFAAERVMRPLRKRPKASKTERD